jgi:formylglycine-generating enzyme required for sulfatase activity
MSRVYFIRDPRGEHRANEADLPLRVGGSERAEVMLPDLAGDRTVALIAVSEGHAYIQPADDASELYHNHERLSSSAWLKSGDRIQLGDALIEWTVKGDQVFIDATQRVTARQPVPPTDPPPSRQVHAKTGGEEHSAPQQLPSLGRRRPILARLLTLLFVLLLLAAAFVLIATPVTVDISPKPDQQALSGFPPPVPVGERYLTLPGRYRIHAIREGYRPLDEAVAISRSGLQAFRFEMQELPGRISIHVEPDVPFRLFVDDSEAKRGPDEVWEIERGQHRLRVESERYLSEERELEIAGLGKAQSLVFTLRPAWAEVWIDSQPRGAEVSVDDVRVGVTPLSTEILQGTPSVVLSLAGHKPVTLQPEIVAGAKLRLEDIVLLPADGRLALHSDPAGATVRVDGGFHGTTPTTLSLSANEEHRLVVGKPGYLTAERQVTLAPEEEQDLALSLLPEYGTVFLASRPADASLRVDGKPAGKATQRLRLATRPHLLEIRKAGYVPHQITVTPRAGVSQTVDVVLETVGQKKARGIPNTLTAAGGPVLQLIRPGGPFTMGASRREAGRRANESPRKVQLTRPFYIGAREISNSEFRRFKPAHNSGSADDAGLDGDSQPVVNLSWDDAARYCNWLSTQDGLPAAYEEKDGQMVLVIPATTGYRLPTEAEWAYVARVHGRDDPDRYPWAGNYPPTSLVGNFADARIADTLADVVPAYDDGYRGTAPVGSFPARPAGLSDLGGNVAEWTNDFYTVYPGDAERLVRDPLGPATGEHHVVRGSSWRHGNITELRLSYRDYSRKPRSDLGFRIARYAE